MKRIIIVSIDKGNFKAMNSKKGMISGILLDNT